MDNLSKEELVAALKKHGVNVDPALQAASLDAQASAIMDIPSHLWTQEHKDIIRRQCQAVVERGW